MLTFLKEQELFQLNQILADLHDSNDCISAFTLYLERLKALVQFDKGNVYFYRNEDHHIAFNDFIFVDWGKEDLASYTDQYADLDDVLPLISNKQPIMFRSADVFIESERRKTKYYAELIVPAGMQNSIEGNLFVDDYGNVSGIGIHRSDQYEDFSLRDLEILKLSRPHLAVVAKKYYEDKKTADKYLDNIPFLSSMYNLGICIWNYNLNLVDDNLEQNEHFTEPFKTEIKRTLCTLCRSLREKINALGFVNSEEKNRIKSKITFNGKSYFADVAFTTTSELENGRFVAMLYDYSGILLNIFMEMKEKFGLTDREFEVMQCMMNGMSNMEIGEHLFISIPTVKKHLTSVYSKMNIEGKHQILGALL